MTTLTTITLLASAVCLASAAGKLPKNWKTCKRSDKNMNDCLKSAAEFAVHSLKNGNQQLGVLPLDPFHFNKLTMDGGNGPVSIKLDLSNLNMHGISTAKVERFKADWENHYLEANITFGSDFVLLGDYEITGRILLLPIVGHGKCNLTFQNFEAHLTIQGHEVTKGKNKYLNIDKFTVDIGTSRFILDLQNLFNGDKALSDNMNVFLNQNWRDILGELRPSISRAFGEGFRQVANQVFSRIPIDVISPK